LFVLPAAGLTIVAMLLVARPLGHVLFPVDTLEFWPSTLTHVDPKPTEQTRYLISLLGAVLVPLAILVVGRRGYSRVGRGWWTLPIELAFVFVLACGVLCRNGVTEFGIGYFTWPTILVALLVGLGFVFFLTSWHALPLAERVLSNRARSIRVGVGIVAVLATAVWLLPAIQLDSTVVRSAPATTADLIYTFDEGLSVVNGHSPLVNYVSQYGSLWPYVIAIPLHFANGSLGGFTCCMVAITFFAMMAAYGVIRRVARSPLGALALFLPFLASSFFLLEGTPIFRYSFGDYFGVFPLRYAGPYLVAFLIARHLSGDRPKRVVWIFVVGGLTLLNNGDFGVPALGASLVALIAGATGPRDRRWWARFGFEGVGGLVAAYAVVAVLTLSRTGQLPNLALLFRYAHLFALAGYNMVPMPWFGFWVVIYLTFAATLALSVTMLVRRSGERVDVGMLAWVGIFGLGIGSYYAGRSYAPVLIAMFSAWSLALALLVAVTARSVARSKGSGLRPVQVALFVGFGLAVCSLAQLPVPWRSIDRLTTPSSIDILQPSAAVAFVQAHSEPGEPVVLLDTLGQRISREAGVDNVNPYTGILSMPTKQQLAESLDLLRDAGGTKVYLRKGEGWPELGPALERSGFRPVVASEPSVDKKNYPPPDRIVLLSDAGPG
jgi:hypothetical protein